MRNFTHPTEIGSPWLPTFGSYIQTQCRRFTRKESTITTPLRTELVLLLSKSSRGQEMSTGAGTTENA